MQNKNLTLIEHGYIYAQKGLMKAKQDIDKNIIVPEKVFTEIENFILKNPTESDGTVSSFLIPSFRTGTGKILKALNYVGVIQTKKGITIEILPKISQVVSDAGSEDPVKKTKAIFLKMLRTLKSSNFKISNYANLDLTHMSLLDVFINMFLDELDVLIKQGIRKSYVNKSENLFMLKGKLDFNKNISKNFIHKERFFVHYDEFNPNRPENKLIKSTLLLLQKKVKSNSTQQKLRRFTFIFNEIYTSDNIDVDFQRCKSNRLTSHYDNLLIWCRIFLKNRTFTSYKGNDLAFALLFPMEKIFEDYVAYQLRKSNFNIQTQKDIGNLLHHSNKFKMKPDIIFTDKPVIADTKWKIIDEELKISQSDLYQMFAYGYHPERNIKRTEKIILIYPLSEKFPVSEKKRKFTFFRKDLNQSEIERLELEIYPFDLEKEDNNRTYFQSI